MALLQSLHEPFRRIDLLLDESGRLLFLTGRGIGRVHQYVRIFLVHPELRQRESGHGQHKIAVHQVKLEVGHDLLSLVIVGVVDLAARRGIELHDLAHGRLHFLLGQAQLGHDSLEMPV